MAPPPKTIGVIGAGTMGAGIAQLACLQAEATTLLHDPVPEALERGTNAIRGQLAKGATRGRWTEEEANAADERLTPVASLADLAEAELVIEAAPESLELKQDLFAQLEDGVVSDTAVLATNTSSLLVTAVASKLSRPERVVGMHFFNPPPVMALLEVVAGAESGDAALATARAAGEAMGKRVIDAIDGPGFLVNRCNRPWGVEALKLLSERIAPLETIDRVMRQAGGFRMGPFELMDLVGVDVGLAVSKSFYEQSFGEPRWQPSPITVKTVSAGRLGRKSKRGYYDYSAGTDSYREPDEDPPSCEPGDGVIVIAGDTPLAADLEQAATAAGWTAITPIEAPDADPPFLILDASLGEDLGAPLQGGPQAILTAAGSLATLDAGGSAVGFHALPPLDDAKLIELTRGSETSDAAADAAERFFASLGKHVVYVDDAPGLVLGRIVCQIINECAFALGEGVGSAADIDTGLVYGMNHPRGPLGWADQIGIDHVLAVLDALYEERREERYRLAPELRGLALSGRLGRQTGEGFFGYDA
jgi:3-hydroxybutyryl-CoA dehydrogenase